MATQPKSSSNLKIILLIVLAMLLFIFLGAPSFGKLKNNSARAAVASANNVDGAKYIKDIQAAYQKLAANPQAVALLNTAAPTDSDIAGALVQIGGIATDSGLSLNALSPTHTDNGDVQINAMVSGDYGQLEKFLTSLENNLRPFVVSSIAVTAFEENGGVLTAGNYAIILSYVGAKSSTSDATTSSTGGQ